jgi:4'-phosphopantetheinyl transferase
MRCKVWPGRSAPPELPAEEAHVWAVWLDPAPAELASVLSSDERERAQRLVDATAGKRSAAAHGALKVLLGAYTGTDPFSLAFATAPGGKPFLRDVPWLCFNLAHSEALALVAVAHGIEIGVDVERLRVVEDASVLAERYLAPEEACTIAATPEEERSAAFLRHWTRKEAALKATGEGLSGGLDSRTDKWTLHELEPDPGYMAVLALPSPECRPRCFTLQFA